MSTIQAPPNPGIKTGARLVVGLLVSLAILSISACDPADGDATATTGCSSSVRTASQSQEVDDQIASLDVALMSCRSYSAFKAELAKYPGIIGYDPETFVSLRCTKVDDRAIRASPTCTEIVIPTTTIPPTTLPGIEFVAETLDGRNIVLRPSATLEFVGGIPEYIQQNVDIAFESGCEGVIAQRDTWALLVDDPVTGDEASAYAQHAQNVANYIGCDSEPLVLS